MADELLKQRLRASEAEVQLYVKSLKEFLKKNLRQILKRANSGEQSAKESARIIGKVQTLLEKAGLSDEIAGIKAIYQKEIANVEHTFKTLGANRVLSDTDMTSVEALISFDTSRINDAVAAKIGDVKATMMRSILGDVPSPLAGILDTRLGSDWATEINTSLQAFSRSITVQKSKDLGFDLMEYIGPDDAITRPFCEDLLTRNPPIYTMKEIEKLKNDSDLPVSIYGGGYNCRHHWRPISEENAKAAGYKAK